MKKIFKSFLTLNPFSITTGLVIIVMALFLIGVPFFDMVELKTYDLRLLSRGIKKPSPCTKNHRAILPIHKMLIYRGSDTYG